MLPDALLYFVNICLDIVRGDVVHVVKERQYIRLSLVAQDGLDVSIYILKNLFRLRTRIRIVLTVNIPEHIAQVFPGEGRENVLPCHRCFPKGSGRGSRIKGGVLGISFGLRDSITDGLFGVFYVKVPLILQQEKLEAVLLLVIEKSM